MMTGKCLKQLVGIIPDDAGVMVNGNWNVSVEAVSVETSEGRWSASLNLTKGYSVTSDEVLNGMFNQSRKETE